MVPVPVPTTMVFRGGEEVPSEWALSRNHHTSYDPPQRETQGEKRMSGFKVAKPAETGRRDFVVRQLIGIIRERKIAPGARLPAEPELADMFGVSRTVVREAMQTLQATGTIRIEQGRGTFLAENPLAQPFSVWATMNTHRVGELFAVRSILEAEAASLAAGNRTKADLSRMKAALDAGQDGVDSVDWRATMAADVEFHRAVTQAAGLALLREMLEVAIPVWIDMTADVARERRRAERLQLTLDEHRAVYDAIKSGDGDAARNAIRAHLANSRDRRIANDGGHA
jgi:DNA-binding FadR family transcriptional regulator